MTIEERVEALRARKAEMARIRAEFAERRQHGLQARHRAKLRNLAQSEEKAS